MRDICNNLTLRMYLICGINLVIFSIASAVSLAAAARPDYVTSFLQARRADGNVRVVDGVYAVIFMLKVLSCIGALIGIKKDKPLLLGVYVGCSTFTSIVVFITTLLLLIGSHWAVAVLMILFNVFNLICLWQVYNGYESMIRGRASGNLEQNLLDEEWSAEDL